MEDLLVKEAEKENEKQELIQRQGFCQNYVDSKNEEVKKLIEQNENLEKQIAELMQVKKVDEDDAKEQD